MTFTGWLAGQRLTTSRLDAVSGVWTPYPVAWTSSSGAAPSLGNGSLEGEYALAGGLCHVRVSLKGGSSTSWGSGQFAFSLPFNAAVLGIDTAAHVGSAMGLDTGNAYYPGIARIWQAGTVIMPISPTSASGGTVGEWNATRPFTWGSGDSLTVQGAYKPV